MSKKEVRNINSTVELRQEGEDQYFEGYAAKFNSRTELWPNVFEEIAVGAFDDVLNDDVRALFNHDQNWILGRTKSGTMQITVDAIGVKYRIKYNPNDPDHVRAMEKVRREDVTQSSFAFDIKDETWSKLDGDKRLRTITKLERWYDVAPVTYPAYQDTTVAARSLEQIQKQETPQINEETVAMQHRTLRNLMNCK